MKYMLLIHQGTTPTPRDPEAWATLSEDEQQAVYRDYQALNETPGVTPGLQLQDADTATPVRVADGSTLTTDGPFAETKEQLGGFYLIEVPDQEEAVRWASRCPGARYGTMEVRPIWDLPT